MYELDDDFLAEIARGYVNINGKQFKIDLNYKTFAVGDKVLDRKDGTHAVVQSVQGGRFALASDGATEVGVTLDRLVKLVEAIRYN